MKRKTIFRLYGLSVGLATFAGAFYIHENYTLAKIAFNLAIMVLFLATGLLTIRLLSKAQERNQNLSSLNLQPPLTEPQKIQPPSPQNQPVSPPPPPAQPKAEAEPKPPPKPPPPRAKTPTPTSATLAQNKDDYFWLQYKEDFIQDILWRWDYDPHKGKEPINLTPYCPDCRENPPLMRDFTPLLFVPRRYKITFRCPYMYKTYSIDADSQLGEYGLIEKVISWKIESGECKKVVNQRRDRWF